MSEPEDLRLDVAAYDRISQAAALEVVRPLCASPAWMDAMVARRPLRTIERAAEISDAVVAALSWQQVEKAVAADPHLQAADARASAEAGDDRVVRQLAVRAALAERARENVVAALR